MKKMQLYKYFGMHKANHLKFLDDFIISFVFMIMCTYFLAGKCKPKYF